jgi:predicted thioesterase
MKSRPVMGTAGEFRFTVEPEHGIDFAGDGMPAVLSTPTLVRFLERAAREVLLPHLESGERSVGAEIEVQHLAPTPLGATVTCVARLVRSEGSGFAFQVEARDDHELIARGFHKRNIIRVDRFAARVRRKAAGA